MQEYTTISGSHDYDAKPFLRWAGGKQKIVPFLIEFCPPRSCYRQYHEPFLGGGSLFFKLRPQRAFLGDINSELINCYQQIKHCVEDVLRGLRRYVRLDARAFYNRIRCRSTMTMSPAGRAARFIYLNKAAFNGIYRVNSKGKFNVPYGPSRNGPAIPSEEELRAAAKCLAYAEIIHGDFERTLRTARKGDFVYLDPPYPPSSTTAFFTHYSPGRFDWGDQERVAEAFRALSKRGCKVMLSNSSQKRVIELYQGFRIRHLSATRWLGSNGDRFNVNEIVVTSYDLRELRR